VTRRVTDVSANGVGWLANMSAKPRTPVIVHVEALRAWWLSFDLEGLGSAVARLVGSTSRATTRTNVAALVTRGDSRAVTDVLDAAWAALGLRGAILLHHQPPQGFDPMQVDDPLLVLNVLGRARSNVVCARSPVVMEPRAFDRVVWCDDPRLVAAYRTGSTK
jgi:hypothetical protein